jgi:PTH2 family peptidyl-tRNA hydrolase
MVTEDAMYKAKQMIVVRRDLKMRKGKIAAQAGHACVEAVLMALYKENRLKDVQVVEESWVTVPAGEGEESPLTDWFQYGVAKICVYVDGEEALLDIAKKAKEAGVVCALIQDAGMTEFHGEPTYTCLALEPLEAEVADQFTGGLPLY